MKNIYFLMKKRKILLFITCLEPYMHLQDQGPNFYLLTDFCSIEQEYKGI